MNDFPSKRVVLLGEVWQIYRSGSGRCDLTNREGSCLRKKHVS